MEIAAVKQIPCHFFIFMIFNGFNCKTAVNAAVSTCHFDSVDIVTP